MSDRERWLQLLEETGALQEGHFLLSSGLHSSGYVQCARVLEDPHNAELVGGELARRLVGVDVDLVFSPPLGGIVIGYEVARQLGVRFVFPERGDDGAFRLRRGFSVGRGQRAAVIEDVITTGRTTRELVEMLRSLGVSPVAVGAIVDRSGSGRVDELSIESVIELSICAYEPEVCPMCGRGLVIVKPGSRRQVGGSA